MRCIVRQLPGRIHLNVHVEAVHCRILHTDRRAGLWYIHACPAHLVATVACGGVAVFGVPPGLVVVEHALRWLRWEACWHACFVERDRFRAVAVECRVVGLDALARQGAVRPVQRLRVRVDRQDQAATRVIADVVVAE